MQVCTHVYTHTCLHIGIGATVAGHAIMYYSYTGLAKIDLDLKDVIIMCL